MNYEVTVIGANIQNLGIMANRLRIFCDQVDKAKKVAHLDKREMLPSIDSINYHAHSLSLDVSVYISEEEISQLAEVVNKELSLAGEKMDAIEGVLDNEKLSVAARKNFAKKELDVVEIILYKRLSEGDRANTAQVKKFSVLNKRCSDLKG